jgi:hypothetical protein
VDFISRYGLGGGGAHAGITGNLEMRFRKIRSARSRSVIDFRFASGFLGECSKYKRIQPRRRNLWVTGAFARRLEAQVAQTTGKRYAVDRG